MSLGTKTILILLLAVFGYWVIDLFVQRQFILPTYAELERAQAQRDLERGVEALRREIHHLDQFCQDWSAWDDTLEFVEGRRPDYIEENLDLRTFLNSDINYVSLIDKAGHVVWSACYNLKTKEPTVITELPSNDWPVEHPLLQHHNYDSSISGIINTALGPLLLSSRPIEASYNQGHIGGTIMMGRFLDRELFATLQSQTQVDLSIQPIAAIQDAAVADDVRSKMADGTLQWLADSDEKAIFANAVLSDVFGKPALLVRVRVPRIITERGNAAIFMDSVGGLLGGLMAMFLGVLMMRRAVTRPLTQFTTRVTEMAGRGALEAVPEPTRNDEIGALARAFNRLEERVRMNFAERLQAESAFRDSETRMGVVLEAAQDAILLVNQEGKVVTANAGVRAVFGWEPQELERQEVTALARPDRREKAAQRLRAFLERKDGQDQAYSGVFTAVRKDGAEFPVHLAATRTHLHAGETVVALIIRDITELNAMHERVARSQRLAEIGQMGASVAHEIRNPIAGISGATQVMLRGMPAEDPRRDMLQQVLQQCSRVENTVRQLLGYARPIQPHLRNVDLGEAVQGVVERAQNEGRLTPHTITVNIEEPVFARVDAELIGQVIMNLLLNAAEAMSVPGEIEIRLGGDGKSVVLVVEDSGPGFKDLESSNKFAPFSTSKVYGNGLGLSICQRIVEAHGGSILLANRNPSGARVVITLSGSNPQ